MLFSKINLSNKILGILLLTIAIVALYRGATRNLLDAHVVEIRTNKLFFPLNLSIDSKSRGIIKNDPGNYLVMIFEIETKNESNYYISNIDIYPLIPSELKERVLWFDTVDGPMELKLEPSKNKVFFRQLIIRRDNLGDSQLIELFKSVKFEIAYYSYDNKNLLASCFSFGYSKSKAN
jgi:hypothetical protein